MEDVRATIVRLKNRQYQFHLFNQYKPLTTQEVTLLDCGLPSPPQESGGDYTPWSCYRNKEADKTHPAGVGECLDAWGHKENSMFVKWAQWCRPFGWSEGNVQRRSFREYFAGLADKYDENGKLVRTGAKEVNVF